MQVIFETHCTSVDNENGVASGHWDAPLSAVGERQAVELGRRYQAGTVIDVFCSDLQRSYRTAQIAFDGRADIAIHKDSRLRECDYGTWTRSPQSRVAASRASRVQVPFPGGESYAQSAERVRRFLFDLSQQDHHPRVLVIGHRATQFALEHLLCGKRLEDVVIEAWSWQPGWTYTRSGPVGAAEAPE